MWFSGLRKAVWSQKAHTFDGAVSIDFGNSCVLATSSLVVGSVRKQSSLALGGPVWILLKCSLGS